MCGRPQQRQRETVRPSQSPQKKRENKVSRHDRVEQCRQSGLVIIEVTDEGMKGGVTLRLTSRNTDGETMWAHATVGQKSAGRTLSE